MDQDKPSAINRPKQAAGFFVLKRAGRNIGLYVLLCIFVLSGCSVAKKQNQAQTAEPITILDLTYLAGYDYTNPDSAKQAWDILHAAATLQGIVNRDAPRLYLKYVISGGVEIDTYWWNIYRRPGEWLAGRDTLVLKDIYAAVDYYKSFLRGAVVYDPRVASTSDVASAVAGIENLVALRYDTTPGSLYSHIILTGKMPVKRRLIGQDGKPMFTGEGIIPGTGIPSSHSVKNDPYRWFIERYMKKGLCNTEYAGYYIDQKWLDHPTATVGNHHTLTNHDFFVSKRGFFFDLSPWDDEPATDDSSQPAGTDYETLKAMLTIAAKQNKGKVFCHIGGFSPWIFKYTRHAGGKHEDVPTEWRFTRIISAFNAVQDADAIGFGALANASFWTHFPLQDQYPQQWVTPKKLVEKELLLPDSTVNGKKDYFLFYVGDYDAASWVYQTAHAIWDDPNRGKLPMMWAISPLLERRVPMALHYFRKTATPNDYFVASDNGAGYLNPGMLQAPRPISHLPDATALWGEHNKNFYRRWGLTVTGFVIDGEAPSMNEAGLDAYAQFSPNGIVPQKTAPMLYKGMPVFPAGMDVNSPDPAEAARAMQENIGSRKHVRFHWFRSILKTPTWHLQVVRELQKINPDAEILDAPSFFQLYRYDLKKNDR